MRFMLPLTMLLAACPTGDGAPPGHGGYDADTGIDTGGGTTRDSHDSGNSGGGSADASEACDPQIQDWPRDWASYEEQVVTLTNQARARGANCHSEGTFGPADPVSMDPYLRCAARYHSLWMKQTEVFDHYSPGGNLGGDPWERMAEAGFAGFGTGENIAAGYATPDEVVQGWLDSDGHCANIMNPESTRIGVGYVAGGSYGTWWTQDYGM